MCLDCEVNISNRCSNRLKIIWLVSEPRADHALVDDKRTKQAQRSPSPLSFDSRFALYICMWINPQKTLLRMTLHPRVFVTLIACFLYVDPSPKKIAEHGLCKARFAIYTCTWVDSQKIFNKHDFASKSFVTLNECTLCGSILKNFLTSMACDTVTGATSTALRWHVHSPIPMT